MVGITRTAKHQFQALLRDYMRKERDLAVAKLLDAFSAAVSRIEADPAAGVPHPRPYPEVANWGFLWVKEHRYWFGYSMSKGYPILTNIHFDTSDIPGHVAEEDAEISLNL